MTFKMNQWTQNLNARWFLTTMTHSTLSSHYYALFFWSPDIIHFDVHHPTSISTARAISEKEQTDNLHISKDSFENRERICHIIHNMYQVYLAIIASKPNSLTVAHTAIYERPSNLYRACYFDIWPGTADTWWISWNKSQMFIDTFLTYSFSFVSSLSLRVSLCRK